MPAMAVPSPTLQSLCHSSQDFARKRLIRYGACQGHSPHECTESQNCSRSCRTHVLAWKQTGNQLNVVLDLFGGKCTGLLIAARDLPRQCAVGASHAWIITVRFVQIVVDQSCIRQRLAAGCGSVLLTLPGTKGRADRLGN